MTILRYSVPTLPLKKLIIPSNSTFTNSTLFHVHFHFHFHTMNSIAKPSASSSSSSSSSTTSIHQVPKLDSDETHRIADQTFRRYSSSSSSASRTGRGTAILWFRNDLRILDNEALYKAWLSSDSVLPVYCVDPRLFGTTYHFGFPKTGGNIISDEDLLQFLILLKSSSLAR